jgi:translocation and assembly module TamA
MRNPAAWIAVALLTSAPASGAKLDVVLEGLPEKLENAVRSELILTQYQERDTSQALLERLLRTSDRQIQKALEPFGYYHARVARRVEPELDVLRVVFTVSTGEPVIVTRSNLSVCNESMGIEAVSEALHAFAPAIGAPLNHSEYERSKDRITTALTSNGYLSAQTRTHRVEVSRASRTASIDLSWDCGLRYRFGPARFPSTALSNTLLDRMVPWKEGDFYSMEHLLELQERLGTADYFSTVALHPRLNEARDGTVPVDAELVPAKPNVFDSSVYYTTDTGAGVHLGWQRRWINSFGHKFNADGDYAERLKVASLGYRIPFAGPNERAFNFGTSYRDEISDSVQEETARLALNESRKWRGFTRTLGVHMIGGDFEIGSERGNSTELYGEAVLTRTDADDAAFPQRGYSVTMAARLAPSNVVSQTRFASIDARAKWVRSVGRSSRVLLRANVAAMTVDDFDQLPPDLRFFAGGDRSIRGFDYEAIGSTNDAGDVIGGTYQGIVSAEYDRYFGRKWGAAAFVDAGDAFLGEDFEWNVGAGVGIRWKSPVGVVRVDVATAVETALEKSVRVHVSIGPDL